jgi:hypothetical protein
LPHIFDFLKTIDSKDDIVEACALVRANITTLIESSAQSLLTRTGKHHDYSY